MCPSYDGPQAAHLWSVHLTRLTLQLRRNAIEYGKPSKYKLHHFPVKKKILSYGPSDQGPRLS